MLKKAEDQIILLKEKKDEAEGKVKKAKSTSSKKKASKAKKKKAENKKKPVVKNKKTTKKAGKKKPKRRVIEVEVEFDIEDETPEEVKQLDKIPNPIKKEKKTAQKTQCTGKNKDGSPCKRTTNDPSGLCFQHKKG